MIRTLKEYADNLRAFAGGIVVVKHSPEAATDFADQIDALTAENERLKGGKKEMEYDGGVILRAMDDYAQEGKSFNLCPGQIRAILKRIKDLEGRKDGRHSGINERPLLVERDEARAERDAALADLAALRAAVKASATRMSDEHMAVLQRAMEP